LGLTTRGDIAQARTPVSAWYDATLDTSRPAVHAFAVAGTTTHQDKIPLQVTIAAMLPTLAVPSFSSDCGTRRLCIRKPTRRHRLRFGSSSKTTVSERSNSFDKNSRSIASKRQLHILARSRASTKAAHTLWLVRRSSGWPGAPAATRWRVARRPMNRFTDDTDLINNKNAGNTQQTNDDEGDRFE
jgi:hypothetical protein